MQNDTGTGIAEEHWHLVNCTLPETQATTMPWGVRTHPATQHPAGNKTTTQACGELQTCGVTLPDLDTKGKVTEQREGAGAVSCPAVTRRKVEKGCLARLGYGLAMAWLWYTVRANDC